MGGERVRCDLLAVGTELLLGQIVDTNSSWLGEQLAAAGHRLLRARPGRRQPGPHRRHAAPDARPGRRRHRVRRPRPHARRPHPRRHRRGDGRRARAPRRDRRPHPVAVRRPGAGRWPTTTCARPTSPRAPGCCGTRSAPRPGLAAPGRRRQGRLRRAGRALRDDAHGHRARAARPARARRASGPSSARGRCGPGARRSRASPR